MASPDDSAPSPVRRHGPAILVVCLVLFGGATALALSLGDSSDRSLARQFGTVLAAGLTLIMFSFLYGDNPLFKIAENLFVGVALGFNVMIFWYQALKVEVFDPFAFAPSRAALWQALGERLPPIVLGILLLTRLSRRFSWPSRYTYALLVGWGSGIGIAVAVDSFLLNQLWAAIRPLEDGSAAEVVGTLFVLAGTVTVLFYFFFSVEHRGVGGGVSRVGVWFLMLAFGASFGYTVMARLSLLIGRLQFLITDWLGVQL